MPVAPLYESRWNRVTQMEYSSSFEPGKMPVARYNPVSRGSHLPAFLRANYTVWFFFKSATAVCIVFPSVSGNERVTAVKSGALA